MRSPGSALSPHCAGSPGLTEPLISEWRRADTEHLGDARPSPVPAQARQRGSSRRPPDAASGTVAASSLSLPPNTLLREPIGGENPSRGTVQGRTCLWATPTGGDPVQALTRQASPECRGEGRPGAATSAPLGQAVQGSPPARLPVPAAPEAAGCLWYPLGRRRACAHARGSD